MPLEHDGVALEAELEAASPPIDFEEPASAPLAGRRASSGTSSSAGRGASSASTGAPLRSTASAGAPTPGASPVAARWRSLYAVAGDRAITVTAVRPAGATEHGAELIAAHLVRPDVPPEPFENARLSTIYDGAGRPRSAGLELLLPGDEYPRRMSGEAVCQTAGETDPLQAACFRWSLDGDTAQGGYHVVSPA